MQEKINEMAKSIDEALIHNVSWSSDNGVIFYSADGIARELFDDGYRKQEWISIEDRLPERNGRYLTHCNIENQSLVCVLYYCKIGGFNEGTVTHWMLLPTPPKAKGGAE